MLEKSLESPLDSEKIKPVNYKGNQSWIFIGRTDAEAPILWSPDAKSWLIRKDPDAGKDWRQEKGMTEVMVGWHDWLNGHGWAPGDGEGQGGQACCSLWFCKESDMTEWQNNQYKLSYFPLCFTRAFCFIWITFLKWIWRLCCASSCLTLCNPRGAHQAPLSMEIFQARILEWVPNPGIKPRSPTLQADSLRSEPPVRFPTLFFYFTLLY